MESKSQVYLAKECFNVISVDNYMYINITDMTFERLNNPKLLMTIALLKIKYPVWLNIEVDDLTAFLLKLGPDNMMAMAILIL